MNTTYLAQSQSPNPLAPNATFFAELIIFLVVLFVLWKYVFPPIQKALKDRHDMVQKTIDENNEATKKFQAAEEKHREVLAEARSESSKIRDEARTRGQGVVDEFRERANSEAADVRQRGEQQLATQREQVLGELNSQVGGLSTALATRVLGEDVSSGSNHRAVIDNFVGDSGSKGDS